MERSRVVIRCWQELEFDLCAKLRAVQTRALDNQSLVGGSALAAQYSPASEHLFQKGHWNGDSIGMPMQPSVAVRAWSGLDRKRSWHITREARS